MKLYAHSIIDHIFNNLPCTKDGELDYQTKSLYVSKEAHDLLSGFAERFALYGPQPQPREVMFLLRPVLVDDSLSGEEHEWRAN